MKKINHWSVLIGIWLIVILGFGCSQQNNAPLSINIIPKPQELVRIDGAFELSNEISMSVSGDWEDSARYLSAALTKLTGSDVNLVDANISADIDLAKVEGLPDEAYRLNCTTRGISLEASTSAGLFYGIQSMLQLIQPVGDGFGTPLVTINDEPRFEWRGMHLDVSRHFFEVDKIKKYIDHLARYKINTFHWHLTDDQGWRIEIKKYPKLTEIGAWRQPIGFGSNQTKGLNEDNGQPYGGFYTQEEVKEIVTYALERSITVVPEIEMPGHTSAVLQAYPELACENAPQARIWTDGGISKHLFCAGREATFDFLEDVLIEVMQLFPSKYIHIGGDEAPKDHWQKCPLCQQRIKQEGLANEHELQSYFVKRMEQFLNENERSLVGWDEILEGGLAPNATVMSWRGEAGGIAAAQAGHPAIITPEHPLYFNHRPVDRENAPGHYSLNNTIRTVYDYNPVPEVLSSEQAEFIIGVQANLWVEHIPKWEHVESLLFPRLLALSEIAWTAMDNKNYGDFETRLARHVELLEEADVNVGKDYGSVSFSSELIEGRPQMSMNTALSGLEIRYTTDGSAPNNNSILYQKPVAFDNSVLINAASFDHGEQISDVSQKEYILHQGIGKKVVCKPLYAEKYDAGGEFGLVDGQFGYVELSWMGWQGFQEPKVEIVVDLEEEKQIDEISIGFLSFQRKWIFYPENFKIEVSMDGKNYTAVFDHKFTNSLGRQLHEEVSRPKAEGLNVQARFVKISIINAHKLPEWHNATGQQPWVFVDEVVIN